MIEAFKETKCMKKWSKDPRCVVKYSTLKDRIYAGWSPETAITLRKVK